MAKLEISAAYRKHDNNAQRSYNQVLVALIGRLDTATWTAAQKEDLRSLGQWLIEVDRKLNALVEANKR